ncbi:hypothetical protein KR215_009659 [Drosophila sulfurigaster]|uniref:Uncharacterized protein LOC127565814 n=1 Tax=Drosophila albomicans TaxID=7291 RepID=A0A9C6WK33_DROAB|nr:uncharacterized protein LOC127565814 [Drosophila albomicans]XP_060662136.1 uncharacterized protein LOC132795449 [Drosophila nasuta]KAH8411714.1 hypothetical protein KR215_009659 [Drosophila sulfurigaster]
MSRPKQLQHQLQFHLLLLIVLIGLLPSIDARPQDIILDATQLDATQATAPTSPALNVPSDLSVGLNLVPVSSLIAAAANAEPPAPIQFVRIAMNSGL